MLMCITSCFITDTHCADMDSMRIWANRMTAISAFNVNKRGTMNTERLLKNHLQSRQLKTVKTRMEFARVRTTGAIASYDLPMVVAACSAGNARACKFSVDSDDAAAT
jgi:hypothetical protein